MLATLYEFLTVALGFFAILSIWFGIQAFVRRRSGCGSDRDVLDHMAHGCAGCSGAGRCGRKRKEHHHELT